MVTIVSLYVAETAPVVDPESNTVGATGEPTTLLCNSHSKEAPPSLVIVYAASTLRPASTVIIESGSRVTVPETSATVVSITVVASSNSTLASSDASF